MLLGALVDAGVPFDSMAQTAVALNVGARLEMRKVMRGGLAAMKVDVITPADIADLVPLAYVDDLVGGVFLPNDGQTNPIDVKVDGGWVYWTQLIPDEMESVEMSRGASTSLFGDRAKALGRNRVCVAEGPVAGERLKSISGDSG